jgi:hypothetical protein
VRAGGSLLTDECQVHEDQIDGWDDRKHAYFDKSGSGAGASPHAIATKITAAKIMTNPMYQGFNRFRFLAA